MHRLTSATGLVRFCEQQMSIYVRLRTALKSLRLFYEKVTVETTTRLYLGLNVRNSRA